jgi:hypothetical protein
MSRSILLLLILLLLLIGVGIASHSYRESFSNHIEAAEVAVSPVMANLTAALPSEKRKELPQIDVIGRDAEALNGLEQQMQKGSGCPVCKEQCPDMSKYIRRDSIPCWNCSL